MQMAARGPSRGANPGNDLAHLHGIPRPDRDSLQVVVRGDQPVAVIYFHAVPAAPGMPAGGPHHAGVGRINPGAAGCSEVLAQVEVSGSAADGADAVAKGRTQDELFKGCHQGPLRRPLQLGGRHIERRSPTLRDRPDHGAAERNQRPVVCQNCRRQTKTTHLAGAGYRDCRTGLDWRGSRESNSEKSCGSEGTRGQRAHSNQAEACRLFVPAGSPMSSQTLTPCLPARPQS